MTPLVASPRTPKHPARSKPWRALPTKPRSPEQLRAVWPTSMSAHQGGDLTALLTPSGSAHGFGYDGGDRNVLYSAPTVASSEKNSTTYTYGVDDLLESITLPSGRKFERTIDSHGHLTNWKTPEAAVVVTYDSKTGNIAGLATNDETVAHTWDGSLLLSASWSGTMTGKVSWKYDNALRPVSETVGSNSVSLTYDSYGRLSQIGTEALGYASDGTSLAWTTCGQISEALSYSSDYGELSAHKVTGGTGASVPTEGATTYTYDTLGQLRSVQLPSKRIDYLIDPAGRRVGKRVDGQLVKGFLFDGRGHVVAELDGTGTVLSQFAYGSRRHVPDLMLRGGKTYRLVSDYLGSVRLVVDTNTSSIAQQLDYDVWGRVTNDTSPGLQPFGFAGGLYDTDTGLVRFGARDYDPATGRWTNKDPILFGGGQTNLYVYVGNDPVNFMDPSGLYSWSEFGSDVVNLGVQAARGVWTSPQLVAGLAVGALGSGVNAAVVGGNLEFYDNWAIDAVGTSGLTLRNIIIYSSQTPSSGLRAHEQQHIPQSDLLGPFYLPAHILSQAIGEGIMGMPHSATPLECGPSDASNRRPWP